MDGYALLQFDIMWHRMRRTLAPSWWVALRRRIFRLSIAPWLMAEVFGFPSPPESRPKLDPAVRVWATVHSQPWWSTPSYAFFHVSCDLMFDIKVMRLRTASNQPHSVAFSHSALQHHPRQLWRFGSWYEQHQHQGARPWHSRQGLLWSWGLPILQGQPMLNLPGYFTAFLTYQFLACLAASKDELNERPPPYSTSVQIDWYFAVTRKCGAGRLWRPGNGHRHRLLRKFDEWCGEVSGLPWHLWEERMIFQTKISDARRCPAGRDDT